MERKGLEYKCGRVEPVESLTSRQGKGLHRRPEGGGRQGAAPGEVMQDQPQPCVHAHSSANSAMKMPSPPKGPATGGL